MSRRFVKFQNFRNIGVAKDKNRFENCTLTSLWTRNTLGSL